MTHVRVVAPASMPERPVVLCWFPGGGMSSRYFDLDPPYDMPTADLARLVGALPAGGLVVVERSSRGPFTWPDNRVALRERAYGETTLWYGR